MTRTERLTQCLLRTGAHIDPATREKYSWWDRGKSLEKYSGRTDVFGSFTEIFKLGINPQSTYNTPIGIYCYPVDYIIKTRRDHQFDVEFQGNAPYLHVFSVSNLDRTLKFDYGDTQKVTMFQEIHEDWYDDELYTFIEGEIDKVVDYIERTRPQLEEIRDRFNEGESVSELNKFYKLWYIGFEETAETLRSKDVVTYSMLTGSGDGNISLFSLILYADHPYPKDRFMERVREWLSEEQRIKYVTFPYEDQIRNLSDAYGVSDEEYYHIKDNVLSERVVCDQAFCWNMTRHLSAQNPRKWTGMMRQLGLIGAIDHGTKTIHENEPAQAVFFDMRMIKVLEVIDNKKPRQQQDIRNRSLSQWSRDPDVGTREAIAELLRILYYEIPYIVKNNSNFQTPGNKINYAPILVDLDTKLNRVYRVMSWLVHHGQEEPDHGWGQDLRDQVISKLQELSNQIDESLVRSKVNKILQVIQRVRR